MEKKVIKEIGNLAKGHLFYNTSNTDQYINNLISFIEGGLRQEHFCLIIESDRLWLKIKKRLTDIFSAKQLERVIHMKNFDFYFSTGEFHVEAIVNYFSKTLSPFLSNNLGIRTWAHVEWGNGMDMTGKIKQFEQKADEHD
ncbi:MEDS domain-containing protein [Bacillus sp. EB01]|uniref:MEDS domain-containing protein n=1 Tax=Bacillus sp. EB01 TaxID=1347086 RepID=UPI000693EEA1|nr:MEDS domain-containing protein [Bacillus sp. EB01]